MTDCSNGDVRDALPDYLHDRLDTVRRREVEAHLAGCDTCREELALLRALRVTMRRAPAVDAEAIAAAIPPYRAPARRGWAMGWRAAAAVVALVVGGTSIALLTGRAPGGGEDVTQYVGAVAEPRRDVETRVEPSPSAVVPAPAIETPRTQPVTAAANRELAMAGATISDLSDRELSALVEGIESLDAVLSTDVEGEDPMPLGRQEDS
jgi:anti-sigma factor RsiW